MVTDLLTALALTPGQARFVGALALFLIVALDVFASGDDVPGNTPREWLRRLTQSRSPLKWITGALVPFSLGCLTGHFFHPWPDSPLGIAGFLGLGLAAVLGLAFSALTGYRSSRIRSGALVFVAALLGIVAGVLLWPVK